MYHFCGLENGTAHFGLYVPFASQSTKNSLVSNRNRPMSAARPKISVPFRYTKMVHAFRPKKFRFLRFCMGGHTAPAPCALPASYAAASISRLRPCNTFRSHVCMNFFTFGVGSWFPFPRTWIIFCFATLST